ncbi:MAG: uroporphyrinogen decarboxylase family protein [Candidatus Poribacteria bacterium]
MAMTRRENCLAVMNRDNPEWIIYHISYTPDLDKRVRENLKVADSVYQHNFPGASISAPYQPSGKKRDFSKYYEDIELPEGAYIDGMGIGHIPSSKYHFDKFIFPMRNFTDPIEVEEYPWPDEPPYDEEYLKALKLCADNFKAQDLIAVANIGSIFEMAWYLRGMDNLLADFVLNEDLASALLDRITEMSVRSAWAAGIAGADMLGTGDDVGMQNRMIMSPDEWRKWIKPRFARVISAARENKPDIHVKYHSDGFIEPIIPDLIEIGVTILNPVQPECMDPVKLKKQYGDRLAFDGTIGIQTTMPFGTTQDVENAVKYMIETVGKGGGLIIAPTHVLEPEVPIENIKAFLEAVDKYGHY